MKLIACAVHDGAAGVYLPPFFVRAIGEAVRMFQSSVNQEGHQFNQFADDYTLFRIGQYDDSTGMLEQEVPLSLGNALEYRKARVPSPQLDIEDAIRSEVTRA